MKQVLYASGIIKGRKWIILGQIKLTLKLHPAYTMQLDMENLISLLKSPQCLLLKYKDW